MLKIELLESFIIGHPEIDADHQEIVNIINDISAAIDDQKFDLCKDLFASFMEVVKGHFRREEAVLRDIGFPRIDQHCDFHRKLVVKAEAAKELCENMTDRARLDECFQELAHFLIEDIVKGDLDFKSYLESRDLVAK